MQCCPLNTTKLLLLHQKKRGFYLQFSVFCFLVKRNCTLMPGSTMVLMSVLVHPWGLEGSWGLQQSEQTDFALWNSDVSDHSSSALGLKPDQLLSSSKFSFSLKAWCLHEHFALQQAQLWLLLCDPEAGCSQLRCQMHRWTHAAPWPLLDLLHMCLLPAWTYWPGHCLLLGILMPLLNWLFAFGGRENSCLWLRSVMTSYFN